MGRPGNTRALLTAVQFLTRVPVPGGNKVATPELLRQSVVFFPLVGSLIGLVTAGALWAGTLVWPVWLAVIVALAVEALFTGAFHEDALADFFDAFGGGWTPKDILNILKDSRIGSFGAVALVLGLAMRGGAMAALDPGERLGAIVAASTAGRWVIVLVMAMVPPVPERESLARDIGQQTCWLEILGATVLALPGTLWWATRMPLHAAVAGVALLLTVLLLARVLRKAIGGLTGDCLGTICYISQVIVLLAAAATW